MGRYFARKVDGPHSDIVEALRKVGFSVVSTAKLGGGAPDLLVGRAGVTVWLEVKSEKGRGRESQALFALAWRGCKICVVRTPAQAIAVVMGTMEEAWQAASEAMDGP